LEFSSLVVRGTGKRELLLIGRLISIAEDYSSSRKIELNPYNTTKETPNQMIIECHHGSQFTRFHAEAGASHHIAKLTARWLTPRKQQPAPNHRKSIGSASNPFPLFYFRTNFQNPSTPLKEALQGDVSIAVSLDQPRTGTTIAWNDWGGQKNSRAPSDVAPAQN
jgi:hypothetical protein